MSSFEWFQPITEMNELTPNCSAGVFSCSVAPVPGGHCSSSKKIQATTTTDLKYMSKKIYASRGFCAILQPLFGVDRADDRGCHYLMCPHLLLNWNRELASVLLFLTTTYSKHLHYCAWFIDVGILQIAQKSEMCVPNAVKQQIQSLEGKLKKRLFPLSV
jgi:hypothetical protein